MKISKKISLITSVTLLGMTNLNAVVTEDLTLTATSDPEATCKCIQEEVIEDLKKQIVPKGSIIMWNGTTPPDGWVLCDGTNGTPDLRDRFIVGAGSTYSIGTIGGSADAVNVAHTHQMTGSTEVNSGTGNITWGSQFSGDGDSSPNRGLVMTAVAGTNPIVSSHSHKINATINSSGVSGVNKNLPPYYALAFIMKIK